MPTIDEKRVYTDNSGTETVLLATGLGVVSVSVSDDLIGEFGLLCRCEARDVATAGSLVAVGTDEDVLLADRSGGDDGRDDEPSTAASQIDFTETGFGPATAVGFDDGSLLAGDGEGRVARSVEGDDSRGTESAAWTDVGATGPVRAIDSGLVAAADGVYRMGSGGVTHAGLDDARDVDAEPLVATGAGLYKLGNGWMDVLEGPVEAVDAVRERGLAAVDGALYARGLDSRESGDASGGRNRWTEEKLPVEGDVVAVTHGVEASYAVTADGTLAVRLPDDEWRYRVLGVRDVAAATV